MGPLYCGKRIQDPVQGNIPSFKDTISFQQTKRLELEEEINSLLQKGQWRKFFWNLQDITQEYFLSQKIWKNEVHNRSFHFKQRCSNTKLQNGNSEKSQKFNSPQRLGISLDLTDAYLHVPIHPTSRKYLHFALNDKIFQFRALPFGLSTSPYMFTHLMKVIASHLHRKAVTFFPYLDHWLSRNHRRLTNGTQTINHSIDYKPWTANQSRKVRHDSISEIHFHRDGISNSPQHSQNSSRQNPDSVRDNQAFSSQNNSHSQIIPVSFRKTQCRGRLCNSREISSQTITNVSSGTMETSYSSTSPPY